MEKKVPKYFCGRKIPKFFVAKKFHFLKCKNFIGADFYYFFEIGLKSGPGSCKVHYFSTPCSICLGYTTDRVLLINFNVEIPNFSTSYVSHSCLENLAVTISDGISALNKKTFTSLSCFIHYLLVL